MATDAKQYIISFLATLKGNKAVVAGLNRMKTGLTQVTSQAKKGTQGFHAFTGSMDNLIKRAVLTIPVWLLMRSVFMGLIRTIGDIVRSNLAFEEQMARIKTVMHGTAMEVDTDMALTKQVILDMAVKSRLGIEQLAEGFYFLRTANLDTKQAIDAFTPAVNLAVGTGNELAQTTRALAGIYNTMGKSIKGTGTDLEAFERISDVLAFTYATQDVQLSELVASYEKFAPFISGLDDSFVDIVTTLGFLNTRMLRAGRAGRLTGRAIIQLSKNASKLAEIFGITFDPDKPVNFIDTLREINRVMKQGTKLTQSQSKALSDIFATRGKAPIALLLESFDELEEALELAGLTVEGFAQKMNDIRMGTVSAQSARLKSVLAVLGNEFITGATGAGSYAESLELLNDTLADSTEGFRFMGNAIGFVFHNLSQVALAMETFHKSGLTLRKLLLPVSVLTYHFENLKIALEDIKKQQLSLISFDDYVKNQEEAVELAKTEESVREDMKDEQVETTAILKTRTKTLKEQNQLLAHQVNILKIAGVHEKDIVQFKIDQFEILAQYMEPEEEQLQRLKLQNELLEAQAKFRKDIAGSLQTTALSLLKTMGASESQILEIKIQQLFANKQILGDAKFLLELTKLRHNQQRALLQEKQKEMAVATNLYLQYKKADEFERTRLRRLMELRQLSPTELAKRYKEDMFDQRVIDEYFSHFSEQGRLAIGEIIAEMFDLDATTIPGLATPPTEQWKELLNPELANPFWDNWDRRARESLEEFARDWSQVLSREGGLGVLGVGNKERLAIEQTVDLKTTIENISINLPTNALENVAEEAGKQVTDQLLTNEDFQKKFIDKIRKLI